MPVWLTLKELDTFWFMTDGKSLSNYRNCYKEMLHHGEYRCATCGKSLVEMSNVWRDLDQEISATPMPDEYTDSMVWILCRDCNQTSHVKFHVIGMKCLHCDSYNTCSTDPPKS